MKKTIIMIIFIIVLIGIIVSGFLLNTTSKQQQPKERKLQTVEEIQNMINTIYSSGNVELPELETASIDATDEDQVSAFTGLQSTSNVEELVISVPLMNAQAYSLAVVKANENADIEQMKQEMLDNIDMRRWICVSAEKLYITNYENIIFLVMSSDEVATPIYNEFKKFVENDIGKELEKSEEENIELPPEMY